MALGSTQPLAEMSTRCISWGKGGRCLRLTTLPPSCAVIMKSGNLNFLEPSGPLQACSGTALPLPLLMTKWDPIKLTFLYCTVLYYMHRHLEVVCNYWLDDGLSVEAETSSQ